MQTSSIHSSFSLSAIQQFKLADIGEGITECELVQWFVKPGDAISQFDKICEVQSDKATVEITSRFDGKVTKLYYKAGEMAKVGSVLIDIEALNDSATDGKSTNEAPQIIKHVAAETETTPSSHHPTPPTRSDVNEEMLRTLATPAVRRIARENNVSIAELIGTGKDQRVTKTDILAYLSSPPPSSTATAPSSHATSIVSPPLSYNAEATVVPLTAIQKAMVKSMSKSLSIPHFLFSDEVSFLELAKIRAVVNSDTKNKISFMPLLLKTFSAALLHFPLLNASFDDASDALKYRPYHNIGIAMDTPQGLVVPNIKNVQLKSIKEISIELVNLQELGRNGKLPPSAFTDTTITLSNIGNVGGRVLGPVIPPGTVCISAIGRAVSLPRYTMIDGVETLKKDSVVTISFSADHRVVDGVSVARFFALWKSFIEHPSLFLLNLK